MWWCMMQVVWVCAVKRHITVHRLWVCHLTTVRLSMLSVESIVQCSYVKMDHCYAVEVTGLSVCQSVSLSVCLSVYVCLSIRWSICLSVCPSLRTTVAISLYYDWYIVFLTMSTSLRCCETFTGCSLQNASILRWLCSFTDACMVWCHQWLECKIRGGERYIQVCALTMVVCLSLAL